MNAIVTIGVFIWVFSQFARALKWLVTRAAVQFVALFMTLFALLILTKADSETVTGVGGILALSLVTRLYAQRSKDTS